MCLLIRTHNFCDRLPRRLTTGVVIVGAIALALALALTSGVA